MKKDILKVGDIVWFSGSWGHDIPKKAKVEAIDTNCKGRKYGDEVEEIPWKDVTHDNAVITVNILGNKSNIWGYGNQISKIK